MNEEIEVTNLIAQLEKAKQEAQSYRSIILEFMMTTGNMRVLSDMKQEREHVRIIARNILDMSVEIGKLKTENETLKTDKERLTTQIKLLTKQPNEAK